jgi:hypothetical protein
MLAKGLPEVQTLIPQFHAAHSHGIFAVGEGVLISNVPPAPRTIMNHQPVAFLATVAVVRPETPSAVKAVADVVPVHHVVVVDQIVEIQSLGAAFTACPYWDFLLLDFPETDLKVRSAPLAVVFSRTSLPRGI